ncbi:MAG: MarC family protein [Candidatus Micrarchaeota archaeon]
MLELFPLESFLKAFALIFAIMDPFGSLPVFLVVTKKFTEENRVKAANQALLAATAVVLVFLFFGNGILDLFRISYDDFRIAGGAVLLVLGAQLVFGYGRREQPGKDYHVAATIIGVPLITGPGVITSLIVLSASEGFLVTLCAALVSLFVNWVILLNSGKVFRLLGENVVNISSKVLGLLLIAVAVGFIRGGLGG